MDSQVYVIAATRTPIGRLNGQFSKVPAINLGGLVVRDLLMRTSVEPRDISSIIMGQVLHADLPQNPAKQAGINGNLPDEIRALTINMGGGSGLKAVYKGFLAIKSGEAKIVIAGGQENTTLAECNQHTSTIDGQGIRKHKGCRIAEFTQCPYTQAQVELAVKTLACEMDVYRLRQDQTAYYSHKKAAYAIRQGFFINQITPVFDYDDRKILKEDEMPVSEIQITYLAGLKPLFNLVGGGVTSGNMSQPGDGAAALMLCNEYEIRSRGLVPMATIIACTQIAVNPFEDPHACIDAIEALLKKTRWNLQEVDLFEIDESFAAHSVMTLSSLPMDSKKVNITGGSIALGYPIGAAGAVSLVILLYNLHRLRKKKGIVATCAGGGMGISIAVEIQNELMPSTSTGIF